MKVASTNLTPVSLKNAADLEKAGELEKAISMYEKLSDKAPGDLVILSRLMIISRRLKDYKKEISYINKAIAVHEQKYSRLKSNDAKVISLSKKLNTLLGHTDRKGKNLLLIPEVVKLKKRKDVAAKKMNKAG